MASSRACSGWPSRASPCGLRWRAAGRASSARRTSLDEQRKARFGVRARSCGRAGHRPAAPCPATPGAMPSNPMFAVSRAAAWPAPDPSSDTVRRAVPARVCSRKLCSRPGRERMTLRKAHRPAGSGRARCGAEELRKLNRKSTPSGVRRRPTAIRGFCALTRPARFRARDCGSTVAMWGGVYFGTARLPASSFCSSISSTTSVGPIGGVIAWWYAS